MTRNLLWNLNYAHSMAYDSDGLGLPFVQCAAQVALFVQVPVPKHFSQVIGAACVQGTAQPMFDWQPTNCLVLAVVWQILACSMLT